MNHTFTYTFAKKLFLLGLTAFFAVARVFAQAPVISSFSPASGPVGTVVIITGSGFAGTTAKNIVFFGATQAKVTAASATSLSVIVPVSATYQPISVLNGNNALTGFSDQPFVTTFMPNKGSITKADFMPRVAYNTFSGCFDVSVNDLDGDGKPDLIVSSVSGDSVRGNEVEIFRNVSVKGTIDANSFAPKIDFAVSNSSIATTVGDVDGDGKPDLIVVNNQDSTIAVFHNTSTVGSISFAPPVMFHTTYGPVIVRIADMDGDGKPDLVLLAENGFNKKARFNSIYVFRNTGIIGAISFAPGVFIYSVTNGDSAADMTVGDLDGDGKPDIVEANYEPGEVIILRNTATPGSINSSNSFAAPLYFNTGNGGFTNPYGVAIGDLDGDGKPDLVVVNTNETINLCIYHNTSNIGSISFAPHVDFPSFNSPNIPIIGDLDGDGKPDIVVSSQFYDSISVYHNTSTKGSITNNSFAPLVNLYSGQTDLGLASIAIADMDGDGRTDIEVANESSSGNVSTVSILRNNPFFPPAVQATNVTFTATGTNTTTASWTNGNGEDRAVFISAASAGSPLPVNSTTYTANSAYGLGTQIASSGWYCIYNGTGSTVNITGLSSGATYRVMVVEYNGGSGPQNYLTTTATGNPANVTTLTGGAIAIDSINRVTAGITNAAVVQYKVIFATAVTGITAGNFALISTGISGAGITSVSGSGSTYTVTVNTGTGDGTLGLNLAGATGLTPGIITPLPFAGEMYTLDRTPPTINISAPSVNTIISGAGTVTYTVTYADAHFNTSTLSASNISLNRTGSATGTLSVKGSGTSDTVTVSGITGSGSLGISIAAGSASDLAGNVAPAIGPSATFLVSPILNNITISSGTLSPVFSSGVFNYSTSETYAVSALTVTPTTTDPDAAITVNGGSASTPVNLAVGFNTITVNITSLDGNATTVYSITVLRAAPLLTGQPPDIAYGTGNIILTNALPFSVTPTNTGGAVPPTYYGQVTTLAGSPVATAGYINGTGTAAQFNVPQQMVSDAAGDLYVTDAANNAIRLITPAGVVTTFAGSLTGQSGLQDGPGASALFNYPNGITIDASGNLFVSDYYNNAIRKITITGLVSTFYASSNTAFNPAGLCIDASGNLVVTSQGFNQIVKISPAGVATVVAGISGGYLNGPAATAQFNNPTDVKADATGNLFVADYLNNAIRKITPAGLVSTFAGSAVEGNAPGYANGAGTAAVFNNASGLVVGPEGVIYVADMNNNDIRQIFPDGTVGLTAGSATQAPGNADGIGTAAGLNGPDYIYIDGTGTGYFAEFNGNRVRKLVLTGYTLKGTLPAGLAFNVTTGIISGTPIAPFATQTDTVTAYNAFGYSTMIVKISYQSAPAIATLINLQLSSGTLTPVFASETTNYTAAVSNSIASIILTPTATDNKATITVNGTAVISGVASGAIPLAVGPNIINTIVTAEDGSTTKTYTVIVNRAPGSDATLTNLVVSAGALSPVFAGGTTSYTDNVSNTTSTITVTPTTSDNNASITVNGVTVASGTASTAIPLAVGPNIISTVITAQDGITTDTYTVIVTRAASSVATLDGLTLSEGTLTPAFSTAVTAYTDAVPNSVTSITVTPTFTDINSTITVNGVAVASGTASAAIPLVVGPNIIAAVVTAQDGITTDTYTVVVTRAASSVATLDGLTVSEGTLTPVFSTVITAYSDAVPNAIPSMTISPTFTDINSTITVNGAAVTSGTASAAIPLAVGPNTITTVVTAQDGTTTNTYTVIVTRAASTIATLIDLTVSEGVLTPAFDSGTFTYADSVDNNVTSITVTPTVTDSAANIKVNGTTVSSGAASGPVPLHPGDNIITVQVTAQDGTTTDTYTVTVFRGNTMSNLDATNVITPNGDGKNDYWVIKNIDLYPQNNVTVFDKAGRVVYTKRGYNNTWDGTLNGNPLAQGTYYYVVDLGPGQPNFRGFISIVRN